jgi:hypothetical protein
MAAKGRGLSLWRAVVVPKAKFSTRSCNGGAINAHPARLALINGLGFPLETLVRFYGAAKIVSFGAVTA